MRGGRWHAQVAEADRRRRRKARPPKPGAHDAAPVGYLYVPCARIRRHGYPAETRRWVQEVPIVKKTAKLIYYTSDSWDRREAVVSPGCISREQFETDTRCHDDCPADTRGVRCARHGYTWEHCPHGEDRCRHGYPAGVIPIPGHRHRPGPAGRLFFATREAAEDHLYRGERERAGQAAPRSTTHQGAAPRHGRRPPRPWRHGRAVHPSAPPVPDGASARATVTCSPRRPPADTTALREDQMSARHRRGARSANPHGNQHENHWPGPGPEGRRTTRPLSRRLAGG